MSVTFHTEGQGPDYDDPSTYLNLANANACELLEWLALPRVLCGELDAHELAVRCRRRLWDIARNHDPARAEGRLITCARRAGYGITAASTGCRRRTRSSSGSSRWRSRRSARARCISSPSTTAPTLPGRWATPLWGPSGKNWSSSKAEVEGFVASPPDRPSTLVRRLDAFEGLRARANLYRDVLQVHVADLE
jgi:hypothetical protein